MNWTFVSRAFSAVSFRAFLAAHPFLGQYLIFDLADGEVEFGKRLCSVLSCSENADLVSKFLIFLDVSSPFLLYYALLCLSVSFYLHLLFCPAPLKKYLDKGELEAAYPDSATNNRILVDWLPKSTNLKSSSPRQQIIDQVFITTQDSRIARTSKIFLLAGIFGMAIASALSVLIASIYVFSFWLGLLPS